jgi:hypothetical protein
LSVGRGGFWGSGGGFELAKAYFGGKRRVR